MSAPIPSRPSRKSLTHLEKVEAPGSMLTKTAAKALAVLRLSTGFVFPWAFLDKTFGLGYATPTAMAWIHGGSLTRGFLASIDAGPLQSFLHTIAGQAWGLGRWWASLPIVQKHHWLI